MSTGTVKLHRVLKAKPERVYGVTEGGDVRYRIERAAKRHTSGYSGRDVLSGLAGFTGAACTPCGTRNSRLTKATLPLRSSWQRGGQACA